MEANAQNVWKLRDWTRPKRTIASPPLHTGNNSPPAITHEEKCQVLHKHLFPDPATLPEDPLITLTPDPEDIEYNPVTNRESRVPSSPLHGHQIRNNVVGTPLKVSMCRCST